MCFRDSDGQVLPIEIHTNTNNHEEHKLAAYKARYLFTNSSDLLNPTSHPHTRCVSPVQLPLPSLLLVHHQYRPCPPTLILAYVLYFAPNLLTAAPAYTPNA
ncbi:hypothetical protein CY34DRAFT_193812 [Suillus luteus UH-Slu-Lm8-n1]|uniref:Uncharacterized protein n=1 Tax=Suillus luteus UH-Slu-Lm8-n1 TaxID=930992 RepID=A0A0D0B1A8_9AGAM|nr:hypothetical protein CY34DRAFT_193812 [Suillus luteus UH-Slu-Lm8-n1]